MDTYIYQYKYRTPSASFNPKIVGSFESRPVLQQHREQIRDPPLPFAHWASRDRDALSASLQNCTDSSRSGTRYKESGHL